jgi:hypothetical protein
MSHLMKMPKVAGIGVITVLIAALLCGFALSTNINAAELEGTTESVSTTDGVITAVVVGAQTILNDNNTKIEGILTAGSKIEINYTVKENGNLLATKIEVADIGDEDDINDTDNETDLDDCEYGDNNTDSDDNEKNDNKFRDNETEGSLTSFSNTQVLVNGKTILIDANTKIEGTLVAGAEAEIKYIVRDDGTLLATSIEVDSDKEDIEDEEDSEDSDMDDDDFGDNKTAGALLKGAKVEGKNLERNGGTLSTKIKAEDTDDEEDIDDEDQDKPVIKSVKSQNNSQTMDSATKSKGKLERAGKSDKGDRDD